MKRAATILMILTVLASEVVGGQDGAVPDVGLHLAALQGNVEVVRQHIRSGTDLDARDAYGSTPLMIAATFGRAGVAEALIDAGADLHIRNNDGGTPLHAAAFLCRTEIVALLVNRGANKYVRDRYGNTPAETVIGAFDVVKPAYDRLRAALGPFGLNLDDEHLRTTRPLVAEMLRPTSKELSAVEFTPVSRADWPVSTPAAEGLEPDLLAELYRGASAMSNLYSVLVIKNGRSIGERYFNEGSIDRKTLLQSVTKSYTRSLRRLPLT